MGGNSGLKFLKKWFDLNEGDIIHSIDLKFEKEEEHGMVFSIPKDWRIKLNDLSSKFFVGKGFHERIHLYTEDQWNKIMMELLHMDIRQKKARYLLKFITSNSYEIEINDNLLFIPKSLLFHCHAIDTGKVRRMVLVENMIHGELAFYIK